MNHDDICEHRNIEDGKCVHCGEFLYMCMEKSEEFNNKADIDDYLAFIDSINSLPNWLKEKTKQELVDSDVSFPNGIKAGCELVYRTVLNNAKNSREPFNINAFDREISNISNKVFNRKDINRIRKNVEDTNSDPKIVVNSPKIFVKEICDKNNQPELNNEIIYLISQIEKKDKDHEFLELFPNVAAAALFQIVSNKNTSSLKKKKHSQTNFASGNSISPMQLKTAKERIENLMSKHNISVN